MKKQKNKKRVSLFRTFNNRKNRLIWTAIGVTFIFLLLSMRLFYLMVVDHKNLASKAQEQWTNEVKIDAKRGKILDTNGLELAVSANVYRVDLDLKSIREYIDLKNGKNTDKISTKTLSKDIGKALDMDESEVLKKLEHKLPSGQPANSVTLIRRIEKYQADKVKALKIRGIIVSPDTKRYYVNNNLLSHVLGVTDTDSNGLSGIELKYNKELSGIPGMRIGEVDRQDTTLPYSESTFTPPVNGKDITLTIDERLQNIVDKAATSAMKEHKAKAASVIIMNPKNGEVLALSNKPDFNCNTPYDGADKFDGETNSDKLQKMWRNMAVSDAFEPGSIFKVITAIAALEDGVAGGNETYYCPGFLKFPGMDSPIHCWKKEGHGVETFSQIMQNSCNVAFMEIGAKLGKEKLNEYIKKFGLGELSGVDLPGETPGIVKPANQITPIDLATISFGQTDTVNPVQFMAAFNAIANNGLWIQPHVMKEISHIDSSGNKVIDEKFDPKTKEVASEENCKKLREVLEDTVSKGSGHQAFVEGAHIGGKTGTAEKVYNGVYMPGKYLSSFIGMAPANDPKVTVMVVINEPQGEYFGGLVSAPIAKIVFEDLIGYLNLN